VDCFIGTIHTVVILKGDNVSLFGVSDVNPHAAPPTIQLNPDPEEPALNCPQGVFRSLSLALEADEVMEWWSDGVMQRFIKV
jgi:hypothetical protein